MVRELADQELAEAFELYFRTMWEELSETGAGDKYFARKSNAHREVFMDLLDADSRGTTAYGLKIASESQKMALSVVAFRRCGACGIDRLYVDLPGWSDCCMCPCKWSLPEGVLPEDVVSPCEYSTSEYARWRKDNEDEHANMAKAQKVLSTWVGVSDPPELNRPCYNRHAEQCMGCSCYVDNACAEVKRNMVYTDIECTQELNCYANTKCRLFQPL